MLKVLFVMAIIVLFFVFCGWLGYFVLELLFDTAKESGPERTRTILRYALFGVCLQLIIQALFLYVLLGPGTLE